MIQAAILSLLSALGILLMLWCLLGWIFFPADGEGYCVLFFHTVSGWRLGSHLLLRQWGLQRLPLILVCLESEESQLYRELAVRIKREKGVLLLTGQEWNEFRETERSSGVPGRNPAGNSQRCDFSEYRERIYSPASALRGRGNCDGRGYDSDDRGWRTADDQRSME